MESYPEPPGKPYVLDSVIYFTYIAINFDNSEVKGNGTPLQYSCLVNPMDGGAW